MSDQVENTVVPEAISSEEPVQANIGTVSSTNLDLRQNRLDRLTFPEPEVKEEAKEEEQIVVATPEPAKKPEPEPTKEVPSVVPETKPVHTKAPAEKEVKEPVVHTERPARTEHKPRAERETVRSKKVGFQCF